MSKKIKNRRLDDVALRDYFAGLSLQALIYVTEDDVENVEGLRERASSYAQRAYLLADAMMAERGGGEDEDPVPSP